MHIHIVDVPRMYILGARLGIAHASREGFGDERGTYLYTNRSLYPV